MRTYNSLKIRRNNFIGCGKMDALFGSYDWGDGEWMRTWAERMEQAGAQIVGGEGLICHGTPGADAIDECESLGREVAGL